MERGQRNYYRASKELVFVTNAWVSLSDSDIVAGNHWFPLEGDVLLVVFIVRFSVPSYISGRK